ncbi:MULTISPECIES: DUF4194 domain-containing protein [unclassified Ketobacter]|uniref:DUF4194 domain-containing protein n=1 Tax=unclassified Ketobacter TaxID=2639109 RepID=UPI000F29A710|nr:MULTISPECIES: DUF4194 domain-containing protein [unclassified Ketobacter]RLT88901.1 MAG: DUF4194 domain-containing protein [Ketobacter sp. GenoA1]RLT97498.1 MAG: DUF4194 domain-containing protein [Ketobacter sp.]
MKLTEQLQQNLAAKRFTLDEFSELLIRLLDYGVLSRDESQIETLLYDRYVQLEDLVLDYLSPMQVRVQHDARFGFVRLFPPGAKVPGLPDDDNQPFSGGFRTSLTQSEIAAVLVLRAEYDKALREGQVDDLGCVLLSLEGFGIAMRNLLNRTLPEKKTERGLLFRRLRQLRLIHFISSSDDMADDAWLKIRPSITSFVSEAVLEQIKAQLPGAVSSAEETAEKTAGEPESTASLESSLFTRQEEAD